MLVYGTKIKYKRLGYAADFCPLCGEVRQFAVERVGSSPHLYYVSFGEGKLVEHRRVCLHCHTQFEADPHDYRTLAPAPGPIDALVRETFHNLAQARAWQLENARMARVDPHGLPDDIRYRMLMEPFLILSSRVAMRSLLAQGEFQSTYLRREIYPLLGAALARLQPSEGELAQTLSRLHQMKDVVAKGLKAPALLAIIKASATPSQRAPLSRHRGGGAPARYMDAARLFRLAALIAVAVVLMVLLNVAGDIVHGDAPNLIVLGLAGVGAVLAAVTLRVLVPGIERRDRRARVGGIVLAALSLPALPVGTLFGGYVLWCLTSGWTDFFPDQQLAA